MSENEKFHHYEVLRREDGSLFELGRGAMGITFKAFDTNLRVTVALKVINTTYLNSDIARQRFVREARAAARLSHPNVAAVFHLGEDANAYFYAMEFIAGETVEGRVKRHGPLPALAALQITLQVAKALRAAEREGLVHRDIKPANLMLVADEDEELFVKVIDFGLAKSAQKGAEDATVTVAGFVGTPHFASPEQLEEHELDVRSDIYSLGITLWWMLTGKPPFTGSLAGIMRDHLQKPPPFEILAGQPPELIQVLRRMIEKDPAMRPQNASELRREVEAAIRALSAADATATHFSAGSDPGLPVGGGDAFATQAFTATPTTSAATAATVSSAVPPTKGAVLAGRYRLLEDYGDGRSGRLFKGLDNDQNRPVAVKVIHQAILLGTDAQMKAEREVEAARNAPHPNLVEIYSLERIPEGHNILVSEWVNGFSLLDLMRGRSRLNAQEAAAILEPVAEAADYAAQRGLHSLGLALNQVMVGFRVDYEVTARPAFLSAPLAEWPDFEPKLNPVSLGSGGGATYSPEQTLVAPTNSGTASEGAVDYPRQVAALAFELLSGSPPPRVQAGSTARIPPLPTLSEEGNIALRRALAPGGYVSSVQLVQALRSGQGGGGGTSVAPTPQVAPPPGPGPNLPPPPQQWQTAPQPGPSLPPIPPNVTTAAPAKSGSPIVPIAIVAVLLGGGVGGYFFLKKPGGDVVVNPTPVPTQVAQPTPAPTQVVAVNTPVPTPAPAETPTPVPTLVARVPTPTPVAEPQDRRTRYLAALEDVKRRNLAGNPSEELGAYVRVVEDYPEQSGAVEFLETVVAGILDAAKEPEQRVRRFNQLKPLLERAATAGSQTSLLFLGEMTENSDASMAADYYSRAAQKGNTKAMVSLGNLLFKGGPRLAPRPQDTAQWYRQASELGDVQGKVLLAECLRDGKGGVGQDYRQSVRLLSEVLARDGNNTRALDALAVAYEKGNGVPINPSEARRLMEKAAELGNSHSMANLGSYYMRGLGMARPDQRRAVELFKRSADLDNPVGMFFYAQCLEGGLGVNKDLATARIYYVAAAQRGLPPAIAWCERNSAPYR
ncbi:MAG: protein kinase [Verrucomicrobia bacterium]|nr:protein kinase [Verrucomicrobiota bacterium]